MTGFEFIEHGYKDKIIKKVSAETVINPQGEVNGAKGLAERVSAIVQKKIPDLKIEGELFIYIREIASSAEIDNLMDGTINLVNTVLEYHSQGKPIETLLFLDKSARNGFYLFWETWQQLKKRKEIPVEVNMPRIRFMNIGRDNIDKHHKKSPIKLLQMKYHSSDFVGKRVAVVDEFVSSGQTLRRGLKTIQELYGTVPLGLAQFRELPDWYSAADLGIKGVSDQDRAAGYDYDLKLRLDSLSPRTAEKIHRLVEQHNKETVLQTISEVSRLIGQTDRKPKFLRKFFSDKGDTELKRTLFHTCWELMKDNPESPISNIHFWQYFHYAGEYTAIKLANKEKQKNFSIYRKVLGWIVECYMNERDRLPKVLANTENRK